jgi:hypothetical protein
MTTVRFFAQVVGDLGGVFEALGLDEHDLKLRVVWMLTTLVVASLAAGGRPRRRQTDFVPVAAGDGGQISLKTSSSSSS